VLSLKAAALGSSSSLHNGALGLARWEQAPWPDCADARTLFAQTKQIVKSKIKAEDGRGRFKTTSDKPLRIADREKRPALKT
jgi:hypothetical protein